MFKLISQNKPAGDQPNAIEFLVNGLNKNTKYQVLLGATGTGKTFTVANVIEKIGKPTIVLSHNKTLAAQLYTELKALFPENRVEYFVSNFDYYRPEAYMPSTDTYIDKSSKTNWDLDAMRLSAINALALRKDTIVVCSVAAIYAQLSPKEYIENFTTIKKGDVIKRNEFLIDLVKRNYTRNDIELQPATFRAKGDVIDISPPWSQEIFFRIDMFGDEIENIFEMDALTGQANKKLNELLIFPGNAYTTSKERIVESVELIKKELVVRLEHFKNEGKLLEAQRLEQRVNADCESLLEYGICPGIENYSRYLDGRDEGEKPYTIFDYMPDNSLMIIDESHMMIPQLNAMFNGDRARKTNLVEYGFRLPSALDNRPLKFNEFEEYNFNRIFVSATPAEYELTKAGEDNVVQQIVRPTGLIDPTIEIVGTHNQIEDIYNRLQEQKQKGERTLIMTVTKKMAEELSRYLKEKGEKVAYVHSDHKTFERDEIIRKLRKGVFDALIGINLLREGIDIPEVSLILLLDADKESFFRSSTSLIQIVGRAARNANGKVIFYGDHITKSMQYTIDETLRRREIQIAYNKEHGIVPKTIIKPISSPLHGQTIEHAIEEFTGRKKKDKKMKKELIADLRRQMLQASRDLDFERAAQIRDIILELETDEDYNSNLFDEHTE